MSPKHLRFALSLIAFALVLTPVQTPFDGAPPVSMVSVRAAKEIALDPAGCVAPPPGMVAWWPGDGDAQDIQGGNHGTLQDGATYAAGQVSQAFSFDGAYAHVVAPNSAALQITDAITIDAWINPSSVSQDQGAGVVAKGSFRRGAYAIDIINPGTLRFFFYDEGFDNPAFQVLMVGWLTPAKVNTWSHIAATYDSASGVLNLYDNGTLVASSTAPVGTRIGVNDHELSIGSRQSGGGGGGAGPYDLSFAGLVDEVEIFNRALTPTEIAAIYNAGGAGKCKADPNGDGDGDGVPDSSDNCPSTPNPDQANNDNDAQGDACDADDDNDGIPDACDVDANPGAADIDRDGIVDGSGCDTQIGPPRDKEQCKHGAWMSFNFPRTFKNQGDCIQFVNTGK